MLGKDAAQMVTHISRARLALCHNGVFLGKGFSCFHKVMANFAQNKAACDKIGSELNWAPYGKKFCNMFDLTQCHKAALLYDFVESTGEKT